MATLEDLIYKQLTTCNELKQKLSTYGGKPAVFYQSAPDDKANGWKGKKQYPRIDYIVDMQSNPERKTSGVLTLNIWSTEDGTPPEEIEPTIRRLLCGVFLQPDNEPLSSMEWNRSDAFDIPANTQQGIVIGETLTFDVYAFPIQTTIDPDPIIAINRFIKEWEPTMTLVGQDKVNEIFTPTDTSPACYFRLETMSNARETNTVVWMDATLAGHIFADGSEVTWIRALIDRLATEGEITMIDTSPMFIRNLKTDSTLDALSAGQIRVAVHFGILRRAKYAHQLRKTNIPRETIVSDEDITVKIENDAAQGYIYDVDPTGEETL